MGVLYCVCQSKKQGHSKMTAGRSSFYELNLKHLSKGMFIGCYTQVVFWVKRVPHTLFPIRKHHTLATSVLIVRCLHYPVRQDSPRCAGTILCPKSGQVCEAPAEKQLYRPQKAITVFHHDFKVEVLLENYSFWCLHHMLQKKTLTLGTTILVFLHKDRGCCATQSTCVSQLPFLEEKKQMFSRKTIYKWVGKLKERKI